MTIDSMQTDQATLQDLSEDYRHYRLFLDDERFPANTVPDSQWIKLSDRVLCDPTSDWIVCRTVKAAIHFVMRKGCPYFIMFDHDLQTEDTGLTFAKWLVNRDLDCDGQFFPDNFGFFVHSQNVNGAANIQNYLNRYFEQR